LIDFEDCPRLKKNPSDENLHRTTLYYLYVVQIFLS